jgi:hypothetical protein
VFFSHFIMKLTKSNVQDDPNKSDNEDKHTGLIPFFLQKVPAFSYLPSTSRERCHFLPVTTVTLSLTDEPPEKIDLSCFSGILHRDVEEKSRNCWTVPDSKSFKVRSKNFARDKSKVQIFHSVLF